MEHTIRQQIFNHSISKRTLEHSFIKIKGLNYIITCAVPVRQENLVPLIIAGAGNVELREGGVLADLSPTMLKVLGLEQPEEMTGKSIIK